MDNEDVELTEMHDLKVRRQDGVTKPANGYRFLVQKSSGIEDAEQSMDSGSGCGCCPECGTVDQSGKTMCTCADCMVGEHRDDRARGAVGKGGHEGDCGPDCQSAYHDGHRDGWGKGFDHGHRAGFDVGFDRATAALKDVNAVGGIDEKPDINKAEFVIRMLAQLIAAEAREAAVGAHEECDIHILSEAMSLMQFFLHNEQYADQEDDGNFMKELAAEYEVCKAHRKFGSDERKSLASEGKALPDGSYPIPDEDALRRAAILARSGHGDVAAAKRLIAKRARELGVKNPLTENEDAQKGADTLETSEVDKSAAETETFTRDDVSKMIAEALAETVESVTKERDDARDELAVLKATPIPGGPSIMANQAAKDVQAQSANVQKALYHERLALTVQDRELMKYHRAEAARLRQLAA